MRSGTIWTALLVALLVGCEQEGGKNPEGVANLEFGQVPPPPALDTDGNPIVDSDRERVNAQTGVGQKGRSLDDNEGVVVTPVKAFFKVQERLVFEIQLPKAMRIYSTMNGSKPKSHTEFMEKVIKDNNIELPQLPPGHHYVYDPKTGDLMVSMPKGSSPGGGS